MEMSMKKIIGLAGVVGLAFIAATPAHAISEAYRRQLERDHTTQVTPAEHSAPAHHNAAKTTPIKVTAFGQTFRRSADGFAYLNDVACAVDEQTATATTYSQGTHTIIVRKNGHIDLMENGQYKGRMR